MHIGKTSECCPMLKVDGNEMMSVDRERYLGDILTSDGKIGDNIEERVKKGFGKVVNFKNKKNVTKYIFK